MTLAELLGRTYDQAAASEFPIKPSRLKDLQTSIGYLAKAQGVDTPNCCHDHDFLLTDQERKACLDRYFTAQKPAPSPHTIRNTRNNLSYLFRRSRELGVIQPLKALPKPSLSRKAYGTGIKPYQEYFAHRRNLGYWRKVETWPASIQEAWKQYCTERDLSVRKTTLQIIECSLRFYVGFLLNVENIPITEWNDIFNVNFLDRFVRWHSQGLGVRITATARYTSLTIRHLARYSRHPEADAIRTYCRTLPRPEPMHDKRNEWFTLRELEEVGLAILQEAYKPSTAHGPIKDIFRAIRHGRALMLRLLIRIPLRQRNIREMLRGRNLYQGDRQQWYLRFQGEELKRGRKRGKINIFEINLTDYCPDLIPHLEEFLTHYRPRIPNANRDKHIFLNSHGRLYTGVSLRTELHDAVEMYTRKPFYPHLIRTIWASEYIASTGDFATAAYMLNDSVETVMKRYHEILERSHVRKASSFLNHILTVEAPVERT